MQRKNNLLKSKRTGMAMIMAIAVIVIIATIMTLALSLSTQTTKKTTDLYISEQAVLLSKSAAEYALLRISQVIPCSISNLNFNPPAPLDYYDINITMRYIYTDAAICIAGGAPNHFLVTTPEQDGSVLMDIIVHVPVTKNVSSEPLRYFRRSIQKL